MKKAINIITVCAFVLLLSSLALGQTRKAQGHAPKGISPACEGQSIPKGLVIVGYKSSEKCGEKSELIVKNPEDVEIICDKSPMPEGYHLISQQYYSACATADSNPLTNSSTILRDDAKVSIQPPARTPTPTITANRSQPRPRAKSTSDEPNDQDTIDRSSSSRVSRDEIEIAVRKATVIPGMEMQDVSRAWGRPRTNDKLVEEDGSIRIWGYVMGKVYFRNGIVYKIELLKGY